VRIAGAVSTAARLGRAVGAAMGLRRGLGVVAARLRRRG
jgi:hypothetical protein